MTLVRKRLARAVARTLVLLLVSAGAAVLPASAAHATHFRFRDLTWRFDHALAGGAGNVVELSMRIADRRSFYGGLTVGSPFSAYVSTGDGGSKNLTGSVVAVNTVDDWFIAEVRGFHTYATAGPYRVEWESCCTISTLKNSPDSSLRSTTVVNMSQGNKSSPLSLVSPIVHVPATAGVKTFRIPATDPDGHSPAFRLASQAESLVTQPPGLTIDPRTGVVSWDTTGRAKGLWMVTVVLSDPVGAATMNTFLVNLGGTASNPPVWVSPTPPDRTNISTGNTTYKSFTLAATDPDGDRVHITPLNSPAGLNCEPYSSGNRTDLFCVWAPDATGSHLIAFDAQDSNGASAGLRSYRVTSPRYVAFGDSYSSGEGALNANNYEAGTDHDQGGNGCRRATTAYPYLVEADDSVPGELDFVACSGARTWHLEQAQYPTEDPPQHAQFDTANLGEDVELVTLSIGGNDAGFGDILKDCIDGWELLPWNNCSSDPEKSEEPVQDAFARLRGETPPNGGGYAETVPLKKLYSRILAEAPRARVIVVGYPQFFKTGGTRFMTCSGVSKTDQQWTNEKVKEMNALLKEEAESLGLEFVDTTPGFEGHRLCELGGGEEREWFRDIQLDAQIPPRDNASFHPDDDGHKSMAQDVLAQWANPPAAITMTTGERRQIIIDVVDALQDLLSVIARWPGSDVEITLTSPSGKVYHRRAPNGATHLLGPTYEIFQVPNPEVGAWRVELFGADLGADGEPVTFQSNVTPRWNTPPVANIQHSLSGRTLHLDATGSSDPDGDALVEYHWMISDENGTFLDLTGAVVDYTFDRAGDFGVSLRVVDARGKSGFTGVGTPISVKRLYDVAGPAAPLDPGGDWGTVNAGRTIPVKWRLTKDGAPIGATSSFAGVTSRRVDCATGSADGDAVAGTTAGASGLLYHGDGYWQYNWQTDKSWAGTCRLMLVTFDDGSTMSAKLRFT